MFATNVEAEARPSSRQTSSHGARPGSRVPAGSVQPSVGLDGFEPPPGVKGLGDEEDGYSDDDFE